MPDRHTDRCACAVCAGASMDEVLARHAAAVEKYGWAIAGVGPGATFPTFSYTAGIHKTLGQPDLIIVGLPPAVAHQIASTAVQRIRAGERFAAGARYGRLLRGLDMLAITVDPVFVDGLCRMTTDLYGSTPFLQLVWPDAHGRFPGEEGYDPQYVRNRAQPLLRLPLVSAA